MTFLLRTPTRPYFYVHALHGVVFVSFVPEAHKERAIKFSSDKAPVNEWQTTIRSIAECDLEPEFIP